MDVNKPEFPEDNSLSLSVQVLVLLIYVLCSSACLYLLICDATGRDGDISAHLLSPSSHGLTSTKHV